MRGDEFGQAGRLVVLNKTDNTLVTIDPANGKILWKVATGGTCSRARTMTTSVSSPVPKMANGRIQRRAEEDDIELRSGIQWTSTGYMHSGQELH